MNVLQTGLQSPLPWFSLARDAEASAGKLALIRGAARYLGSGGIPIHINPPAKWPLFLVAIYIQHVPGQAQPTGSGLTYSTTSVTAAATTSALLTCM
jgi:hypothetical protein